MPDRFSRLRTWRQQEGLTLEEVSGLTGMSVAMLSRAERGQRRLRPRTKVLIARRLGLPVRALFEPEAVPDDSEMPPADEHLEAPGGAAA